MSKKQTMLRLAALFLGATLAAAAQIPGDPMAPVGPAQPERPIMTEPAAPAAQLSADTVFPAVNPRMFTAALPTRATVESYLKALWGYDVARVWSVAGIENTASVGVSKVTVLVSARTGGAIQRAVFYVLPDQKHVISDAVLPFGAQPFAELRKTLQERADGPARGAAGKDLLLVEFTDLQCPRCKDAHATLSQLSKDFPQARIVSEIVAVDSRPASSKAAAYATCVARQGNDAFFTFIQSVYDAQDALTATGAEQALQSAAGKAGQDPGAIASCAETQATKDAVAATVRLGKDVGVDQTPLLFVNGRMVSLSGASYETLKNIVLHQGTTDGIQLPTPMPRLTTLK